MKKVWILVFLLALFLWGCDSQATFETMLDAFDAAATAPVGQVQLSLPEDAAAATMESTDGAKLYFCDGYTVMVQTFVSGDLNHTLQQVTGFPKDQLTLMETKKDGLRRYSCVWSAAGEGGDQVGRATVLDDGSYHYAVSVMADFETAGKLSKTWQTILNSVTLNTD